MQGDMMQEGKVKKIRLRIIIYGIGNILNGTFGKELRQRLLQKLKANIKKF